MKDTKCWEKAFDAPDILHTVIWLLLIATPFGLVQKEAALLNVSTMFNGLFLCINNEVPWSHYAQWDLLKIFKSKWSHEYVVGFKLVQKSQVFPYILSID